MFRTQSQPNFPRECNGMAMATAPKESPRARNFQTRRAFEMERFQACIPPTPSSPLCPLPPKPSPIVAPAKIVCEPLPPDMVLDCRCHTFLSCQVDFYSGTGWQFSAGFPIDSLIVRMDFYLVRFFWGFGGGPLFRHGPNESTGPLLRRGPLWGFVLFRPLSSFEPLRGCGSVWICVVWVAVWKGCILSSEHVTNHSNMQVRSIFKQVWRLHVCKTDAVNPRW